MEGGKEDFAPFNMAMLHYIGLSKLIEEKDKAYMNNDLKLWYKSLNRIYIKVMFKLKPEEVAELEALLCAGKDKIILNERSKVTDLLFQLDKRLMVLMDKYKMIFPNINVQGGLEKLQERYGLNIGGAEE